jgi:site-specific DNA recombinase
MNVAIYARYSTDNQSDNSIEDQLRICRQHVAKQGWTITDEYSDRAISGASLLRPGIQALISDAQAGRFHIVLAEAMDRLSRDQEDIAGFHKRMAYCDVKIVTLSEGEVSHLHVGLKGTMNALFLKDLAAKTHRGLRGRVELGKSGGGNSYGYDVVKKFNSEGEPVRGDRTVNDTEAAIVRRIFQAYAAGKSAKRIATELNRDGIQAPTGGAWGFTTINGNSKRGTGILNNDLYAGRLVWNRQRYVKNPDTGKRVSRLNPEAQWLVRQAPELRIVDDELWAAVKVRQSTMKIVQAPKEGEPVVQFWDRRRPRYLFSGLAKCGCCSGGYSMISKDQLGCSAARNKGTCQNRKNIRRDEFEQRVLDGLRDKLMNKALFREFCEEFTRELNRARMDAEASLDAARLEAKRIDRELDRLMQLILDAEDEESPRQMMKKMKQLEARKTEIERTLEQAAEPFPLLHPSMAAHYHTQIEELYEALQEVAGDRRLRAADIIRTLVKEIVLTPVGGLLTVDLVGDLAGILAISQKAETPATRAGGSQVKMVAGTGFEPVTFRL